MDLRNRSQEGLPLFFAPEKMIWGGRIGVAVAFVGFRSVHEELSGGFVQGGRLIQKNDRFKNTRRKFEQVVLSGFFFRSPVRGEIPSFRGIRRDGPFGKRKNGCADYGRDGALCAGVEFPNRLDGISQEFDADGPRRFRRKEID